VRLRDLEHFPRKGDEISTSRPSEPMGLRMRVEAGLEYQFRLDLVGRFFPGIVKRLW